jgi:DUF1009 family protein
MTKKKKLTLKLAEIMSLEAEIGGLQNQQTQEVVLKGLLNYKLQLVTKFKLKMLLNTISVIKKTNDELRDELLKEYGTEQENGMISIPMYVDANAEKKEYNPTYIEFVKKMDILLAKEIEVEFEEITLEDLKDLEIEESYPTFMDILIKTI